MSAVWVLDGESVNPGWLPVPETIDDAWVAANAAELRSAWGDAWLPVHDELVPAILRAGPAHRRPEDAFCFQIWPASGPVCLFVHAAVGRLDPAIDLPAPGDALLYQAAGLGAGLQVPFVQRVADTEVLGLEYLFQAAEQAVTVLVEPTLPELLQPLMPAIHSFVQSLTLTASDGRRFEAVPPGLPEATAAASWLDTLTVR
ncbi:hypothetical protein [Microbacterium aurantiacum]|uniref:hypothetical protein n=1 Tax=Microbacterium aurantiacum TaxID=162393 RepID=UPI000C8082C3|nr:hypothetical protein [Microbacterium aurantiacum]